MKYKIFILLFISFITIAQFASAEQNKYIFDKGHTTILFFVSHLGFSDKIGRFANYDGYFIFDKEYPENSSVDITIYPSSIDTFNDALNKVLQQKSWFNTSAYPKIHFKSSKINITGHDTADILGWLSMLGKEKPITLHTKFNKSGINPANKDSIVGFSADSVINRSEFGMNNYVPFIGENVRIHIEVEGIQQNSKNDIK